MASPAVALSLPDTPEPRAVTRSTRIPRLLMLAVTLLAFVLRVMDLTAQSLWYDEAMSVWQARQPLASIVGGLEPDHLPLFFVILKGWLAFAGPGDFALRFFSVLGGVLSVVMIWWLGTKLAGPWLGLAGAFAAAVTPALIYYGQEVRMYAWMPALMALALVAWLEGRSADGRRYWLWWSVHGLTLVVLAHLHYFGALAILVSWTLTAGALAFGWKMGVRNRRFLPGWALSQALVAVLYAPYLLLRLGAAQSYLSSSAGDLSPLAFFWRYGVGMLVGHQLEKVTLVTSGGFDGADYQIAAQLLAPTVVLLLIGLFPSRRDGWPILATSLAVSVLAVGLFMLTGRDFVSRYLMVTAPMLWLLIGLAVLRLWRWWRPLAVVGVLAVAWVAWSSLQIYRNPEYARDDFRSMAAYLTANAQAADAIIVNAGYASRVLGYYYTGPAPLVPLPATNPPAEADIQRTLDRQAAEHSTLWLALWQDYYADPNGTAKGWLDAHGFQSDGKAFHGVTLYRYETTNPIRTERPTIAKPADVTLGGRIHFLGSEVSIEAGDAATGKPRSIHARLVWQPLQQIDTSYRVFVQLINPVYQGYGQKDNRPVFDRWPTDRWQPGTYIVDDYRVPVLPGTPPGEYQLSIGMYDPATGARLPVSGTDKTDVLIGPVSISDGAGGRPDPQHSLDVRLGDSIALKGYDAGQPARGAPLHMDLHWVALASPPADLSVFVHVLDSSGKLVAQKDNPPAAGAYPTARWQPGQYIRDQYDVPLPADLPAGRYDVQIGLYAPDGKRLTPKPGNADQSFTLFSFDLR